MMQEHFLEQKGVYYRTNVFTKKRKTLIFIHGLSGSSSAWYLYEKKFENTYNVLSYDLRGHGLSRKYNSYEDYSLQYFIQDLNALIKHLSLEKYCIISHSFGTLIAIDYMSQHQDEVERAVLISPLFYIQKKWLGNIITPLLLFCKIFTKNKKPSQYKHIDYSYYLHTGDWNIPRMFADVQNTGLLAYLSVTKHVCLYDSKDVLKRLIVPILVIHGKRDSIAPYSSSVEASKSIKKLTFLPIINGDHILVLNEFEKVSKAIQYMID